LAVGTLAWAGWEAWRAIAVRVARQGDADRDG
jgi:hypothetical protein